MLKNIYLPLEINHSTITQVHIESGQRVRKGQVMFHHRINQSNKPLISEFDGWIRFVAIQPNTPVEGGTLLAIVDTIEVTEYRPDSSEFNPHTELGEAGRRGVERIGQSEFGAGYSGELFDAPTEQQGQQRSVKEHPLLHNMKEGVPPKMSNARNNQPATERLAENASQDPKLANQLSHNLQAQLNIAPGPNSSPSLTRG